VSGDYARAERLYLSALESGPRNALIHLNLAKLLERTGRPAEAAAEYDRFLELATRDHREHVEAARAARARLLGPEAGAP
jgi:tetratricopeptide (TPR) repeat protein